MISLDEAIETQAQARSELAVSAAAGLSRKRIVDIHSWSWTFPSIHGDPRYTQPL